jgi:2-dehydropantoate 2-reductase
MHIAIMGTGGVGGYFGGLLADAGEEVTFIARGEHLKALQENGLQVKSVHGDFHVQPVKATDDPGSVGPVDLILFATKTYQIEQAAQAMSPMVGPDTTILPLQNGVDASERLVKIFGAGPVLGGTCHVVSLVTEPGQIEQKSEFRRITLGELDGPVSERVQQIGDMLSRSGAQVAVTDNINKARWTKFLFIASYSGMGAAARVPAGELMACEESRQTLEAAMREVKALASAQGVELDGDIVETTMAFCDNLAAGATASMQRDIMDGRPSELEAQNGYIAHKGAELGVPVPVHTFLYSVLLPQERQAGRT